MNEYDGENSFGTQDRSHDDNGNLNVDGNFVYKYDFKNRLRKVYLSNGTTLIATYDYDAMDRRVHRKVENSSTLDIELYYYYDGISCIEERKVTGGNEELIFHYVNGIRIDEVINFFHFFGASGTEYYYHYDGKGWVIALTEGSESGQTPGEVHRRYEYTPYGVTSIFTENYTAVSESDAFDVTDNGIAYNRTLYAGREYDPETNLYYYRARHYSPETGRFIQRDPIGYGDEYCLMNLYCYVGNNPVNRDDPKGTGWFGMGEETPTEFADRTWESIQEQTKGFNQTQCGALARYWKQHNKQANLWGVKMKDRDWHEKVAERFKEIYNSQPCKKNFGDVSDFADKWPELEEAIQTCVNAKDKDGKAVKKEPNAENCKHYDPQDEYMKANLRCYCLNSPCTDWGNIVRACLACMYKNNIHINEAHTRCYQLANRETGEKPPIMQLKDTWLMCGGLSFAWGQILE